MWIEKIGGVTVLFKSWNLNTILLLGLTLVSKRLIAAYKKFITLTDIGLKRNTDKPSISQNVLHIVLRVIFTKKLMFHGYLWLSGNDLWAWWISKSGESGYNDPCLFVSVLDENFL